MNHHDDRAGHLVATDFEEEVVAMHTDDRSGELRLRKRIYPGVREICCNQMNKRGRGIIHE